MKARVDVQLKKIISNLIVSYTISPNQEVDYQIYNSNNILVFSKTIIMLNTEGKILEDLDVSHLSKGNYILKISTNAKLLEQISITI